MCFRSTLLPDPERPRRTRAVVVVYRGRHCPLCTKFLNKLAEYRQRLLQVGIDVAAVSADSKEQLQEHLNRLDVNFPLFYGLTLEQMQDLGLYISVPRSEKETAGSIRKAPSMMFPDQISPWTRLGAGECSSRRA